MAIRITLPKYIQVMKMSWQNSFVYRLNFIMWRFRTFLSLIGVYFFWLAFYQTNTTVGGYNASQMLTYVLFAALISAFVFSSRSQQISNDIGSGILNRYLVLPIKYFGWMFFLDLGDKAANLFFYFIELGLFFIVFNPPFFIQTDPMFLSLFILLAVLAILLYFHMSALVSMITFWYPEHNGWPIRFLFETILIFLSGGWFPLDILPPPFYQILRFLPFGYLRFFPVKTYLGQIEPVEILTGALLMIAWLVFTIVLTRYIWRTGLKTYAAEGI